MRRLVLRPGGIGDVILSIPAIDHLQPAEVWTRAELLPFFSPSRSLLATGIDTLGFGGQPDLSSFDEIHSWYGTQRADFRAALEALHPRVVWYEALPPSGGPHAADFFAAQVGAPIPARPALDVTPRPNRVVWIHPFSGSAQKNWPWEHYETLARYLRAIGRSVQFVVAPHQASTILGAQVIPDLRELAEWLSGGALYIGNDSGITHLAAASGARTLALFGPTDPNLWSPRGPRTTVLAAPNLAQLTPDRVLDVALTSA
jgi:ADP-heptose:LPS heptosyltransferase